MVTSRSSFVDVMKRVRKTDLCVETSHINTGTYVSVSRIPHISLLSTPTGTSVRRIVLSERKGKITETFNRTSITLRLRTNIHFFIELVCVHNLYSDRDIRHRPYINFNLTNNVILTLLLMTLSTHLIYPPTVPSCVSQLMAPRILQLY